MQVKEITKIIKRLIKNNMLTNWGGVSKLGHNLRRFKKNNMNKPYKAFIYILLLATISAVVLIWANSIENREPEVRPLPVYEYAEPEVQEPIRGKQNGKWY